MKRILVLMATYNGEKYLAEQLDSILRQRNVDVSILVRDDGSHDDTCNILDSYKESGVLEWYTGEHLYTARSFLDLMKNTTEENFDYIAFCDQDDIWDEDKLYVAVKYLNRAESDVPSLYYCGQRLVDKDLKLIGNHELNRVRPINARFIISDIAGCTAVFNKALLKKVNEYEPQFLQMHDTWIFKVCLCLGGNVYIDPDMHMSYRQHGKNTIGLRKGLRGNIRLAYTHITENHIEKQMIELKRGYLDQMLPEYRQLVEYVCGYRKNRKYKKKLLSHSYINFYNQGLNLTYWIKVNFNKL